MSLKYGLNLKKAAPPKRQTIFDDEPDEDDEDAVDQPGGDAEDITSFGGTGAPKKFGLSVPSRTKAKPTHAPLKPPSRKPEDDDLESRQDMSAMAAANAQVKAAEEVDASIFDYDSFHDAKSTVSEAKKEAARQDAIERKPKYINNLLAAADRRKQDQQVAREKALQRERENEGDEFADKEKFVTGAYKEQQEETRRLEAEEKKRAEEDEKRKGKLGGGMQSFYRNMMDQTDQQHQAEIEAAMKLEREGGVKNMDEEKRRTDAELAAEMRAKGVNVHINEEGQITDKRELLTAGLNVAPSAGASKDSRGGADHLRSNARSAQSAFSQRDAGSKQAQRERQTRMIEEQLEATAKRKREEEEEERAKEEREAKSKKTDTDISDAKARYLARKAAKEKGQV